MCVAAILPPPECADVGRSNSMWVHSFAQGVYLASTADVQIARSGDACHTWVLVHAGIDSVLSFAMSSGILYAGCYGSVLCSNDAGMN